MLRSFVTATALVFALAAHAADPHYGRLALTAPEDGETTETFAPDTAKIFLHAELLDVSADTKLGGSWIAEKTGAAPPNYKIDSVELSATAGMKEATFSLSKPTAGWPLGDYRVDLTIDGKPATSVHFKIGKSED